jgi:Acyclic terpene utilisation family protein AtuA
MSPSSSAKRAVRIAGCSGGFTDRHLALTRMAGDPEVDAVVGDWLAEMTMVVHGTGKAKNLAAGSKVEVSLEERKKTAMYAETFLQCFEPCIENLVKNNCKLAVNAGASDTELLAEVCQKMLDDRGVKLKISWIEGDQVTSQVQKLMQKGEKFESLMHGKALEEFGLDPICGQAYLGGLCIAEALRDGADIVLCGRVADAAPIIGVAA